MTGIRDAVKKIDSISVHQILVRSTNWIGDAVMTLPAVQAIRHHFKEARVTVLVKPWVAPVFEHHPAIDHIVLYDSRGAHQGFGGKCRLAGQLRAQQFDLAILLQNAFEAAWIAFGARIPRRAGYAVQLRGPLLTHGVRPSAEILKLHQVHYYLDLLQQLCISAAPSAPQLHLTAAEIAAARDLLVEAAGSDTTVWVALCPGAQYGSAKQWLPERFAELGRRLMDENRLGLLILGSDKERRVGEELARTLGSQAHSLCGKTDLRQAMALIGQCRAMVTNDSGLMHVAAALQVPQVVVVGPTNPVATGPFGSPFEIARVPVECSPCKYRECPIDHRCMHRVTVDMVYKALRALPVDWS